MRSVICERSHLIAPSLAFVGKKNTNINQVVTGHIDGRMTQWTRLYQRIGAAFGVPGFEGAMKQPSTDMHWHDNAVRCMTIAPDG